MEAHERPQKFAMKCRKYVRVFVPGSPLRNESDWTSNVTEVRVLKSHVVPAMYRRWLPFLGIVRLDVVDAEQDRATAIAMRA